MRTLASVWLVVACIPSLCAAQAQAVKKETVQFDGQTLVLAFEGNNPGAHIKEYIPQDQKLETWTSLASIQDYPNFDDPQRLANNVMDILKKANPDTPGQIAVNQTTGEVMIDFVTWAPDRSFVEFSLFRYSKRVGGGLSAQQYALRAYGEDQQRFLEGLGNVRQRVIRLMGDEGLKVTR